MSLRHLIASVCLLFGMTLIVGAVVLGMSSVPVGALDRTLRPVPQVIQTEIEADPASQIKPQAVIDWSGTIDTAQAEIVWRAWMVENGVKLSSLAIGQGGEILHSTGQRRSPDAGYAAASLSKAVTGMCLNQLLNDSPYTWESTLGDLTPEFAKMNFTPAAQMADLTLTQIVTHTSGLPTKLNYGKMAARNINLSSQPTMTRAALKEASNFGARGNHVYSNANYAILGFLIEAMSGKSYGDHCKNTIMEPAGATQAVVGGRMAHAAGYGGWSVSVEDYARFVMHWFDGAQPWMKAPEAFGYDETTHYGMGVYAQRTAKGTYVSHSGRWTYTDPTKPNIGALFFARPDGTTVVVNWDGSLAPELYSQLHLALRDAL